jgi:hypothetical protein
MSPATIRCALYDWSRLPLRGYAQTAREQALNAMNVQNGLKFTNAGARRDALAGAPDLASD